MCSSHQVGFVRVWKAAGREQPGAVHRFGSAMPPLASAPAPAPSPPRKLRRTDRAARGYAQRRQHRLFSHCGWQCARPLP